MQKLIVVESPTKAKHIAQILGREYRVLATLGHIKDLPEGELAVDIHNGFEPRFVTMRGKGETIKRIQAAAAEADQIILCGDPDREGEAISWHVGQLLTKAAQKKVKRAEFKEITPRGIQEGLRNLRAIDENMVQAQIARRIMDRLVGYQVSPLLWAYLRGVKGTSAGRVQSCALKLIYDREKEIEGFTQEEYWSIEGTFASAQNHIVVANLTHWNDISIETEPIRSTEAATDIMKSLGGMNYLVEEISGGQKNYAPPAPFITTTLLQSASSNLGFPSQKTMKIAQELFEGLDINGEHIGLITYHRTDSTRVSVDAQTEALQWISSRFGSRYAPTVPNEFNIKEGSQDGHEAIRPTTLRLEAETLGSLLTEEQAALYSLIYWQFIRSQMAHSLHYEITVQVRGQKGSDTVLFKAFTSKVVFEGWRKLQDEASDNDGRQYEAYKNLKQGEEMKGKKFVPKRHFTKPPAHFTEASLIRMLERLAVGRPSTYQTIMTTLTKKDYVRIQKKNLRITELGNQVVEALDKIFPLILNAQFTAKMEEQIDQVASGSVSRHRVIGSLYEAIEKASKNQPRGYVKTIKEQAPSPSTSSRREKVTESRSPRSSREKKPAKAAIEEKFKRAASPRTRKERSSLSEHPVPKMALEQSITPEIVQSKYTPAPQLKRKGGTSEDGPSQELIKNRLLNTLSRIFK